MARIVRQHGGRFRSASLSKHVSSQTRGVTRDGAHARMFDTLSDAADTRAFAERCDGDRHHFRVTVSPEDACQMADLRAFTRELMADAERDLHTRLDWMAVDHWNTDNPHIHVLLRGCADDNQDLVISRDYITNGFRCRAAERVTLELGPRTEKEIHIALEKEVDAERWTSLDRSLRGISDEGGGAADLRPGGLDEDPELRRLMSGRAAKLEGLGLAEQVGPARWTLKPGLKPALRDLGIHGDIIKTMHRAVSAADREPDVARFALHGDQPAEPVLGRLLERGLHDELKGAAYAIIDGVDGRTHHLTFSDLEMATPSQGPLPSPESTTTSANGSGCRSPPDRTSRSRRRSRRKVRPGSIASDSPRNLGSATPALAHTSGKQWTEGSIVQSNKMWLFDKVDASSSLAILSTRCAGASSMGPPPNCRPTRGSLIAHRPRANTSPASIAKRVTLASGRFAMIDDGLGFQLVSWRPALERSLGQQMSGTVTPGGGVDWNIGRRYGRGL